MGRWLNVQSKEGFIHSIYFQIESRSVISLSLRGSHDMRGWRAVLALYVLSSRQSDSRQSHYKNVNSLSSAGLDIILSHPSGHTRGTVANYELNTEEKTHLFHYLTEISTRVIMPFSSPPPQSIRVMTGDFLDATASLVMALSVSQSVTKSVMHIS